MVDLSAKSMISLDRHSISRMTISERIEYHTMPVPESGCMIWIGQISCSGYGVTMIKGKNYKAHRLAYEAAKGKIPDGLVLDHLCRVRSCCNPDHLEAVTNEVNGLRGFSPPAINARKTHCPNGHLFEGNLAPWVKYGRLCLICAVDYNKRYYKSFNGHRNKIRNATGYRGVYLRKGLTAVSYFAVIIVNKKTIRLGTFNTPSEAALAYDVAAKLYYGEEAKLNFSEERVRC